MPGLDLPALVGLPSLARTVSAGITALRARTRGVELATGLVLSTPSRLLPKSVMPDLIDAPQLLLVAVVVLLALP